MNDFEALMAKVCERPEDDNPRFVIADYFQENGEPERAEFIRLQMHIENHPSFTAPEVCPFRKRERELWSAVRASFAVDGFHPYLAGDDKRKTIGYLVPPVELIVSRGFVSSVRCRLADWVGTPEYAERSSHSSPAVSRVLVGMRDAHGPRIVAEQPVQEVIITTRVSFEIDPSTGNAVATPDIGPIGHSLPTDPKNPIGSAALNWARREAGLPPLAIENGK